MKRAGGSVPLRQFASSLLCALALVAGASEVPAAGFAARPAPGRLLLEVDAGVSLVVSPGGVAAKSGDPSLDALAARFGVTSFTALFPGETPASKALAGTDLSRFFVVQFPPSVDLEMIRAAYAADPGVRGAEFDILQPVSIEVNDASLQWHLESTLGRDAHVTGGWNHTRGDSAVLLAIADTGVDWRHPDLGGSTPDYRDGNVWTNWSEVNGVAGVDDDANGYVDDVRGWDFVGALSTAWPGEDAIQQDNDPSDFNGHGTHVAGIAGAITNNSLGVAGVGYRCKVIALRIGGSVDDGSGNEQGVVLLSAAASAINYARQKGAAAINCSWGSSFTSSLAAAVSAAVSQGMVVVVAAGNDNSSVPSYLGSRGDCFDVAASNGDDLKASFSNYGPWVDVTAPGVAIYSTYFNHTQPGAPHTYAALQGTSMAAPVVTGLVGLVKARTPGLTGAQVKTAIRDGCDNLDTLNPGLTGQLGAGRVNALRTFKDYILSVPADYTTLDKALAASGPGDTLALHGGQIYAGGMYLWRSNRHILGGWNSNFTARDPLSNPAIVQRSGVGPAVEVVAGIDASLVVDGVSFTGGVARQLSTPLAGPYGGGVLCMNASPVFRNCRFVNNTAGDGFTSGGGGGGFFAGSAATLIDCTFSGNAAQAGAGLYVYDSALQIQGGSIQGNNAIDGAATSTGGGIHAESGTLSLTGVTVSDNLGVDEGGGIYVRTASVTGSGVVLARNAASAAGGNLRMAGGSVVLQASEIRGGAAPFGAGLHVTAGASFTLRSTLVASNIAAILGGAVYAQGAVANLLNVTFDDNRGTAGGAAAMYVAASPSAWSVRGCLVTNHPSPANPAIVCIGTPPSLDYNTFWNNAVGNATGVSLGIHDTVQDPLYVNAAGGDVALGLHSPALDSGDPALGENDPDGTRNDRGAYGGPTAVRRAPAPPQAFQVQRTMHPLRNLLGWSASLAADAQFVAVYRSATAGFTPSAATYIASVPAGTNAFSDPTGTPDSWYRLAVVDSSAASSGFTAGVQPANPTDGLPLAPARFALHAGVPNPFNPSTQLRFDLPVDGELQLVIFDARGQRVRVLAAGSRPAGSYTARWDGRDDLGRSVGSGIYVARLETTAGQHAVQKLTLVR